MFAARISNVSQLMSICGEAVIKGNKYAETNNK
jgi:hypothetical protein